MLYFYHGRLILSNEQQQIKTAADYALWYQPPSSVFYPVTLPEKLPYRFFT
jgi:hypothetical protein